ncbi:MAG: MFS transporter [Candidatus Hodarchaeales archaeon]|jgi:DHA3 family macrolide efflux protein-like MFS transporter
MTENDNGIHSAFKQYLLLWTGQKISLLGSSIVQFAIIWFITVETKSPSFLALASLLGIGSQIILTPVAGVYIDRWNRKIIIGTVDFLQAVATIILIVIFTFYRNQTEILLMSILILLTIRGFFQAFHSPATTAITPVMVPHDKLSRMNSFDLLFSSLINLVSPVIAAFLLVFWVINQILWLDVFTFIMAVIPLLLIKIPSVKRTEVLFQNKQFINEFREGFRILKDTPGVMSLLMTASLLTFLGVPLITLLPYYVNVNHLGEALDLAFVIALFQGGIMFGSLYMIIKNGFEKKARKIFWIIFAQNVGYFVIAITPANFLIIGLAMLIIGLATSIVNITFMTILQTAVPLEMQGRVSAVVIGIIGAITPLGMIYSGLAEFIGVVPLFLLSAILALVVLISSYVFTDVRHLDETIKRIMMSTESLDPYLKESLTGIFSKSA